MPRTQLEKFWLMGGVLVGFVLMLLGYLLFISPQRSQTSDVNAQVSAAQQRNAGLRARITSLRQESKSLATYQAQLTQEQLALPGTSGLPDFLRTLQSIGNATLTTVSALTVGPPTDVTAVSGGAPAIPAKPAAASSGPRVYSLPITVAVTGTPAQLDEFLTQLQSVQPRAVLISQLIEGAANASSQSLGKTSLQLVMQAFVAPTGAVEKAQLSAAAGK